MSINSKKRRSIKNELGNYKKGLLFDSGFILVINITI